MKRPTRQTEEQRQWRTTVRLAAIAAALFILLVIALAKRAVSG
jgi:hypothetical protein